MPSTRTYEPDLIYNEWHRPRSIGRFITQSEARMLCMFDGDLIEYCPECFMPLIVVEAKRDVGQALAGVDIRPVTRLVDDLRKANGETIGLLVAYEPSGLNDLPSGVGGLDDILGFRVLMFCPAREREEHLTPGDFAERLVTVHRRHRNAWHM